MKWRDFWQKELTSLTGLVALFLAFAALHWTLLIWPMAECDHVLINDVLGTVGVLLAVPLCLWPLRPTPPHAALLLGLGVLSFAIGQCLWSYQDLVAHQYPFPSLADLAYLAVYPLLLGGVLLLPARPLRHHERLRIVLDGLIMMSTLFTCSWYFVLGPTLLQGANGLLARVVGTIYPCSDLVLLGCLLILWLRERDHNMRGPFLWLSAGLLMIVLADSAFDSLNLHNSYTSSSLLGPVWVLGYQSISLGVLALRRLPHLHPLAPSGPGLSWRSSFLPAALVPALAILLLVIWLVPGPDALRTGVYGGLAVVVTLVLLRQVVAMRDLQILAQQNTALSSANGHLVVEATHDPLTGLPNRTLLQRQLERVVSQSREQTIPAALLLLDLDRFKEINDTLGHPVGDQLLRQIGPRLQDSLRARDLVARLGGDEFAIVLPQTSEPAAVQVAQQMLDSLISPFMVEGHLLSISGSIGIALIPDHSLHAATLLRYADVAMYVAKHQHRGYALYQPEIDQYSPQKLGLLGELRQAIQDGQLELSYQPKVSLTEGAMVGVEALVRWRHPVHGLIPPNAFIPLAERTDLIGPLTVWVLREALQQCQQWEQQGLYCSMAVNLSTRTLYDPQVLARMPELLQANEVAPQRLVLEITESMLMDDPQQAAQVLRQLRDLGVRVSLDDFGTGYSSLGYLKQLPIDEIKIDRTFVRNLGSGADPTDVAIVQAIVAMARPLQCQVVAEGVEHEQAWDVLQQLGCDLAQGYYLSRPVSAAELEQWARSSRWGIQGHQTVSLA